MNPMVMMMAAAAQNMQNSIMNLGGGLISPAINYKYNKKLQDRAFAHQIKMYKNQHQWEVEDLRKAGLNPILRPVFS